MNRYRIFVMLAWEPRLGAYLYPVGVLGLPADGDTYVSWVPLTYERALPWLHRTRGTINEHLVDAWLESDQLAEMPAPSRQVPLHDAVEAALDQVLAEVLPRLHERDG